MRNGSTVAVWVVGVLVLGGCEAAAGGSSIRVMREGRADQVFAGAPLLACTVTQPDPSFETRVMTCVHGDPDSNGFELVGLLSEPIAELPAETRLDFGTDFTVSAVNGSSDGAVWGASGDSSWWTGDLSLTLGEPGDPGRAAVLEGTLETTDVIEAMMLTPITVDFAGVEATLQ